MKSLAEMRAEMAERPQPRRPECSLTLFLAPDLVAESQRLEAEAESIAATANGPRRQAEGPDPRLAEIRDRLIAVYEEMAKHEGEMHLRANLDDGEWRRWCNAHPAREEGEPGYERDQRVTYGFCSADDLLDNLAPFMQSWNGEPLGDTDWTELIEPNTYPGDKAEMARKIVEMYEGSSANFRQRRNVLLGSLKRLNGSALLGTSGSATSDSTAGSPDESSEGSIETDDPATWQTPGRS